MSGELIFAVFLTFLAIIILAKTAVIVPQQTAFVVERLGRYSSTLNAGFHLLIPFHGCRPIQTYSQRSGN